MIFVQVFPSNLFSQNLRSTANMSWYYVCQTHIISENGKLFCEFVEMSWIIQELSGLRIRVSTVSTNTMLSDFESGAPLHSFSEKCILGFRRIRVCVYCHNKQANVLGHPCTIWIKNLGVYNRNK